MSDLPESSAPADDFIHVTLEKSTTSLTDSFSSNKSQYSQVVFHDLSEVYPTDGDICFNYSFQPGVIPQIGDRIALYKVGWSSVSEFITYVFAEPPENELLKDCVLSISFPVENLPKDEVNMYQFCYITSGNIVAGSSIPFTFRKPHGSELVAIEDPNDSGLVVFRSRVTQLQEQLQKSNVVKETLEKTIQELKSELYLVKAEIADKGKKCDLHMEHIEEMTSVIYNLNTEKKELLSKVQQSSAIAEEIEKLEESKALLLKNIGDLKSSMDSLEKEIEAKEMTIMDLNKKLAKSVHYSKQLEEALKSKDAMEVDLIQLKNEKELLQNEVLSKDTIISNLAENQKMLETQIKSLKEELHCSGENFDQLAEAMKAQEKIVGAEMEKVNKKLKEMTERNNASAAESLHLTRDLEKANNQVKTLEELVNSKDNTLRNIVSASDGNDVSVRLIHLEDENSLLLVQVISLEEKLVSSEEENKRLKQRVDDLNNEKILMAEQLSKMNEKIRKLQGQKHSEGGGSKARSKVHCSSAEGNPPHSAFSQFSQFLSFLSPPEIILNKASSMNDGGTTNVNATSQTPGSSTSTVDGCQKCHEMKAKVQMLLLEKSNIRSELVQTKHANDEFSNQFGILNEEAAALRSRIAVLEIELRKAKEDSITDQGEQKFRNIVNCSFSNSRKSSDVMEVSSEFKSEEMFKIKQREESLLKEVALLQRNVESLMLLEAKNFVTIDNLKKENKKLTSEIGNTKANSVDIDAMREALDNANRSKKELADNLKSLNNEKSRLEKQLIELRKESVGKITLMTDKEMLKHQVTQESSSKSIDQLAVVAGTSDPMKPKKIEVQIGAVTSKESKSNYPVEGYECPVCRIIFPPDTVDDYNKHISDHFD